MILIVHASTILGEPHTGTWRPITADEIELKRIAAIPIIRYRYRASNIPNPWIHEHT